MAGQPGKQRVLLLFAVLAGLFLMHGLTGGGLGGDSCHGTPSAVMSETSVHGGHTYPGVPDANVRFAPSHPASGQAQVGEACVPLRPESLAGLFLALFVSVMTAWGPWGPSLPFGVVRPTRPHWPHGPPKTGVQVLHTLSISRT